jgi:phosphoserine phosphatase
MTRFSGIGMPVTAITLVCNPASEALAETLVDEAALALLEAFDGAEVKRRTLSEGVAEDFLVRANATRASVEAALASVVTDAPVDIVVQPAARRKKRLLIADMDSTIIGQECIDELADFAGLKAEISAITERAMRGELDFDAALKERVGMLKGLPERILDECFRSRISLNRGAQTLIATMNKSGATTVLVSGGFTYFVSRVAALAGFQHYQANELLVANGALTGEVRQPILGRAAKEAALRQFAKQTGTPLGATIAVGDGANDLDMLGAAGLGVAYRAKPKVAEVADVSIRYADLTALLFAQGFSSKDFAP